ncbi:MAG: DEAD/DEAH box helicase, partial [Deltaproteobacteria bacterium]|nr:DEAD/DEAH box helicase [Deltaproteobacteria bacterium]
MYKPEKRSFKKRGVAGQLKGRSRIPKITPGAYSSLKKVFDSIGVPEKKKFKPDSFQVNALSAIERSDCLVTAPTGAGKTWIAVKAIERVLDGLHGGIKDGPAGKDRKRAWYASPLKALSNAKYKEFSDIFGYDKVGLLIGDRKENPDAPVIVGTTEILRNQLYDAMHHGESLDAELVVLDEAHFLGDPDRGVVWEEIMIYLPARIPLLMLSATIGNADRIALWLESIRFQKCIIVKETKRPVPLLPIFFHPSGTLYPLMSQGRSKGKTRLHKKVNTYAGSFRPPLLSHPRKLPPFGDIIRVLGKYRLLPTIFFLKSRADCDHALDLCSHQLSERPSRKIRLRIAELVNKHPSINRHRQMGHLNDMGVGSHHSGQLPAWKLVLETLMTEGLLKAVFATSTVAAGVNFPARSIVMLNSDRFNGREFMPLTSTEFHQMTGRAGRRGKDNIGFAIVVPGKFMDIRLAARLVDLPPSDVASQIKINFSMALNLLLSHTPEQIEELLEKSFASFLTGNKKENQGRQKRGNHRKHLEQAFSRHLNFLKEKGFAEDSGA